MNMDLNQLNRRRQSPAGRRQKLIWQPRIICWYQDRAYRNEPLPAGFEGCSASTQLYERLGCSNRLYDFGACLEAHYGLVTFHSEQIDRLTWRHQFDTPVGSVFEIVRGNDENPGQMPDKWYIETEQDLKVFAYIGGHHLFV